MMTARTCIVSTLSRLTLAAAVIGAAACPCRAQAPDPWPPWPRAVRTAEQTGRPIVLVVTSRAHPESQEFRRALAARVAARPQACSVQFTELSLEANRDLAKELGITTVPTILVYRRGGSGLVLAGRQSAPRDAATALDWLAGVTFPSPLVGEGGPQGRMGGKGDHPHPDPPPFRGRGEGPAHHDAAVVRTLGHKTGVGVQASPQQVSPPVVVSQPQVVVQQQPIVQQPVTTTLQTTPMVSTPITGPQAPAVVLQPSSPPVVIQPAPMHVMVGPAPAPVVTFVQAPSPPPQVALASPAPSPPNLFVSGPPAQPQQPSLPSPQQPVQVSVAQTQAAPQQTVQLVSTVQAGQPQVQSQGGAGVQTALLLQQPHLINRLLAALGRHLAAKGNPRVVMNTATPMTVQVPTTMAVQVPSPSVATPQQVTSAPTVQAPPPVAASPQAAPHHGLGGWFHHDN